MDSHTVVADQKQSKKAGGAIAEWTLSWYVGVFAGTYVRTCVRACVRGCVRVCVWCWGIKPEASLVFSAR